MIREPSPIRMIDSKGSTFGFDCCLASPKFRVFQQPANPRRSRPRTAIARQGGTGGPHRPPGSCRASSGLSASTHHSSARRIERQRLSLLVANLGLSKRGSVAPKGHAQPTEMPNALSPISTTVVETRLQQPAAATAIASAKTYRFADKTRPPHNPRSIFGRRRRGAPQHP